MTLALWGIAAAILVLAATVAVEARKIRKLITMASNQLDTEISDLQASVAEEGTVIDGAETLITSLLDQVQKAQGDPAKLQAAIDAIRAKSASLAAAVALGTPAHAEVPPASVDTVASGGDVAPAGDSGAGQSQGSDQGGAGASSTAGGDNLGGGQTDAGQAQPQPEAQPSDQGGNNGSDLPPAA